MTPAASNKRIALAAVAGAHGVKGEVRLKLFSESVESLSRHQKLYVGGAERRLLAVRDGGKTAVARFEGSAIAQQLRACAARSSKSIDLRCQRSKRANIIMPT